MRLAQLSTNKFVLGGVATVAVAAVAGTTIGYQALTNDVTLRLDGKSQSVSVMADTVGAALDDQGIELGEHDIVTPALDSSIGDGDTITVKYARPLDLTVDGKSSTHWVTATSVTGALNEIGRPFGRAEVSVSRSMPIGRDGLDLEVTTPKRFVLKDGARKKRNVELPVGTVKEALAELGVKTDADDRVKPARSKALVNGMTITVTRFRTENTTVTGEKVPFTTEKTDDDTLAKGVTSTVRAGVEGTRNSTYRVTYRNGREVKRTTVNSTVTKQPVSAQVKVGTKVEAPAPTPAANFAGGSTVWDALARCESGGNWAINTGNGYYGGLQFSASSWAGVGGSGLPHQASREEQIKRGQILQSRGGWGQWPACSSKLGLR